MNKTTEEIGTHEKGLEFEKKTSKFFIEKGYTKVLLRERVQGKSGIKHKIDVLVFDNLDQNKMLWACRCKYRNTQIRTKEIGEWIQTCRDVGARPAFASLNFSSDGKKYAESYGVYLITDEQLGMCPSQVIGVDFLSWKEGLDAIDNDIDKVLFCLKSIYQTRLLQDAERARTEPDEELRFEEEELFKLFRDPSDQRLTKFLIYLNKVKREYETCYAFGSIEKGAPFKILHIHNDAFSIPAEVEKINGGILYILERMNVEDLEPFRMNWGDKCRIFLESWIQISNVDFVDQICSQKWYKCWYASKSNKNQGDPHIDRDSERHLLVGTPTMERWKEYFNEKRDIWKSISRGRTVEEIKRLGELFQTDLAVINEEDKLPNVEPDKHDPFLISRIVTEAYRKNKSKVEKIISDLKTER
jgi:hypothetical protein